MKFIPNQKFSEHSYHSEVIDYYFESDSEVWAGDRERSIATDKT